MPAIGADVEQLRATAKQLAQAADQLQGSMKSLTTLISNTSAWRGPDSDQFRSEWKGRSVHSLNSAVDKLRAGADALRRNADQQDEASRADGGAISGSANGHGAPAEKNYGPAPTGLNGLWRGTSDTPNGGDMSGYRVQEVEDAYGNKRYIVYIGGTQLFGHQNWGANVSAISGEPDKAQLEALRRLIPKDAEVMLVGYSQGGMDAQNIAASNSLNVTQIVTYGSPVRNDLDIPAIHLQNGQDIVPSTSAIRPDLWSNRAEDSNSNVEVFSSQPSLLTVFGLGEHMTGYDSLSEKWDQAAVSGADGRAATSADNLQRFQGSVTDQVDIKNDGSGDW